MALVIRLRQQGKKNRHSYRLVVTDRRSPRDGKYVESLGWYDPFAANDKNLLIKPERAQYWLDQGAVLTEKAKALVTQAAPEVMKNLTEKKVIKAQNLRKKLKEKKKVKSST